VQRLNSHQLPRLETRELLQLVHMPLGVLTEAVKAHQDIVRPGRRQGLAHQVPAVDADVDVIGLSLSGQGVVLVECSAQSAHTLFDESLEIG
jgi:hypothetical protein